MCARQGVLSACVYPGLPFERGTKSFSWPSAPPAPSRPFRTPSFSPGHSAMSAPGHRRATAAFPCVRLTFTHAASGALLPGSTRPRYDWLMNEDLQPPLKAAEASFISKKRPTKMLFLFLSEESLSLDLLPIPTMH